MMQDGGILGIKFSVSNFFLFFIFINFIFYLRIARQIQDLVCLSVCLLDHHTSGQREKHREKERRKRERERVAGRTKTNAELESKIDHRCLAVYWSCFSVLHNVG